MAKPIITIIGLGMRGASMGLALQRDEAGFEIVGHDRSPEATQAARQANAVHRTEWNLHRACDGADMVVLAVPYAELDDLFTHIGEDLKPGALVFALVSLMQPTIELAANKLPNHAHIVVGHPILSGVGGRLEMRADLFDEMVFALAPGLQTEPSAVQLASDYVERVGATPFFVDAAEHDGIIAGVEQMPQLVAAILMRQSDASPGWREARRLAGRQFAHATELGSNAEQIYTALMSNRANLLQRLQALRHELDDWIDWLAAETEGERQAGSAPETEHDDTAQDETGRDQAQAAKESPLLQALTKAVAAREEWEGSALLKKWDEMPQSAVPTAAESGFLRQMLFGNLMGKRGAERSGKPDKSSRR